MTVRTWIYHDGDKSLPEGYYGVTWIADPEYGEQPDVWHHDGDRFVTDKRIPIHRITNFRTLKSEEMERWIEENDPLDYV